jgi:hypothetical protein
MSTLKAIMTRGHFNFVGVAILALVVYQGVEDLTRFYNGQATTRDLLFDAVLILALLWLNYSLFHIPYRSGK